MLNVQRKQYKETAICFDTNHPDDMVAFLGGHEGLSFDLTTHTMRIRRPAFVLDLKQGDYLVKEGEGILEGYSPEDFAKLFEIIPEAPLAETQTTQK